MHAGAPGDPRAASTGITEFHERYTGQLAALREREITACPNVMERSGHWSQ
jgi:hypothetical protein